MNVRVRALAVFLAVLVAATAIVLIDDAIAQPQSNSRSESFQRLVYGIGIGAAVDMSHCPNALDPRLDESCAGDCGPTASGSCFCPRHPGIAPSFAVPIEHEGP